MTKRSSLSHFAYLAAIFIKGLDGLIETVAGLAIVIVGPQLIYLYVLQYTAPELYAKPNSKAVQFIQHGAFSLTQGSGRVVVTYLLVHGILKLALAAVLLRGGGRWIYPIATLLLCGFIFFLLRHWALHPSLWLFGFALFDFLTLILVLNEWQNPVKRAGNADEGHPAKPIM